jgi:hypothetical protein
VASLATAAAPHTRLGCPEVQDGLGAKRRKASKGPCVVLETLGWGEREIGVGLFLGIESGGHVVLVGHGSLFWHGWFKGEQREVRSIAGRASKRHGSDRGIPGSRKQGHESRDPCSPCLRWHLLSLPMSFPLFSPLRAWSVEFLCGPSPWGKGHAHGTVLYRREHMGLPSAVKLYPLLHPLAYSRQCCVGRMTRRAALEQLDQQQPSSVQRSRGHVRLALSLISMPCHTAGHPQSAPLTGSACRRHDLPAAPSSPPAHAI